MQRSLEPARDFMRSRGYAWKATSIPPPPEPPLWREARRKAAQAWHQRQALLWHRRQRSTSRTVPTAVNEQRSTSNRANQPPIEQCVAASHETKSTDPRPLARADSIAADSVRCRSSLPATPCTP